MDTRLKACSLLIVEDNRINAEVIKRHLSQAGYHNVWVAENGKRGLEMTKQLRPDLVILDMMMPEMDGFEYCQRVRAIPALATMPIIVQTALEQKDDKLRAFQIGASDYVTKPLHHEELAARVKVHLLGKLLLEDTTLREQQMRGELRAAQAMQQRLLPTDSRIDALKQNYGLDIGAFFEPSSSLGGDCWGAWPISEHRLAVHMFDFSGHGTAAAINVFRIHTLMREFSPQAGDAGRFLTLLNKSLYPLIERNEFATMLYGVIDTKANRFEYCAAAAPPALLYRTGTRKREWLDIKGIPLGVTPDASYESITIPFHPGDALAMASDCLIETKNEQGKALDKDVIGDISERVMKENPAAPAQRIADALLEKFHAHSTAPLSDDLTINVYCRR